MVQPRKASHRAEPTRERILLAAEEIFARFGYDAASIRRIAHQAAVPVALVNYHFGSKEGLYRAIFEKRAPAIYDQRVAGLRLAAAEPVPARRIELVVRALILPMVSLRGSSQSSWFGQIMSRELSQAGGEDRGIMKELFDPVAELMIEAIADCFPDWSTAEVHWAYQTMLGAMMMVMTDTGRIARLSDGAVSADDWEEAAEHIVAILTAGLCHRTRTETSRRLRLQGGMR